MHFRDSSRDRGASPMMFGAPLIVTIEMDATAQAFFDDLRRRHFPPGRNQLAAHVTLFHRLPGSEVTRLRNDLRRVCERQETATLAVTGLRSLGRGVAFVLEGERLVCLRAELARRWSDWLTPQDRAPFRPHVTVQNKVAPTEARALLEALQTEFVPFTVEGRALALWRYRGGPWEGAGRFPFAAS